MIRSRSFLGQTKTIPLLFKGIITHGNTLRIISRHFCWPSNKWKEWHAQSYSTTAWWFGTRCFEQKSSRPRSAILHCVMEYHTVLWLCVGHRISLLRFGMNAGLSQYIFVFYKHNVYKNTEAQIPKKTKHILSIFLSLIFVYWLWKVIGCTNFCPKLVILAI